MARKCWLVYLRLWAIFVTICRVWSFDCKPTDCGCKDVSRGIELDLTAIDKKFTVQNQTVADSSGQDGVLYYFHLCTALHLPGNCSNSLVCERDILSKTYTSFGQKGATSYSVFTQPPQIVMTITDEARRRTVVSLISGSSNAVKLVSANTTTLEFSVVVDDSLALPTHLILALGGFETANTSSLMASSPPPSTFSPSSSGPLTTSSGASTSTQTHSIPPTISTSSISPTPSSPHASPFSNSAFFSSPSPSVSFTVSPFHSTSSSFHSSSSSSLFTSPSSPSPSPSPHPPPPHPSPSSTPCNCTACPKNYALSLGIAVPVTAVTTFLLTLLMVLCCQRVVKRKRQYIRLAPTVYFDEEEHD